MQFNQCGIQCILAVYRDYANDQQKIGDQRVQLIKDYALNYDSLDDLKAKDLVQRMISVEDKKC